MRALRMLLLAGPAAAMASRVHRLEPEHDGAAAAGSAAATAANIAKRAPANPGRGSAAPAAAMTSAGPHLQRALAHSIAVAAAGASQRQSTGGGVDGAVELQVRKPHRAGQDVYLLAKAPVAKHSAVRRATPRGMAVASEENAADMERALEDEALAAVREAEEQAAALPVLKGGKAGATLELPGHASSTERKPRWLAAPPQAPGGGEEATVVTGTQGSAPALPDTASSTWPPSLAAREPVPGYPQVADGQLLRASFAGPPGLAGTAAGEGDDLVGLHSGAADAGRGKARDVGAPGGAPSGAPEGLQSLEAEPEDGGHGVREAGTASGEDEGHDPGRGQARRGKAARDARGRAPQEEHQKDREAMHATRVEPFLREDRLRRRKVEELEHDIARETGSGGLAEMLSGMKIDIFRLRDKVDELEKSIEGGVRMKAPSPRDLLVYPLSLCMRCTMMLTALYFLIYTSAAVCKAFADVFHLGEGTKCSLSLQAACNTVFYVPMVCVIFFGVHLRALQITEGHGGPGVATGLAMEVSTWSGIVQTVLVLAVPVLTGEVVHVDEERHLELPAFRDIALAGFLTLLRYAALAGLYLGILVVCVQAFLMDAYNLGVDPVDLWDDPTTARTEYAPPVSAAMLSTMWLAGLFFSVHLFQAILYTCLEFSAGGVPGTAREGHASGARELVAHWERCLQACCHATNAAPTLCLLFMAARMRALQLNPRTGQLQPWTEHCFYGCAAAVTLHTLLILLSKALGIGTRAGGTRAGSNHSLINLLLTDGLRASDITAPAAMSLPEQLVLGSWCLAMLVEYGSCAGTIVGALLLRAAEGQPTPVVPSAMQCALALAVLYLGIYAYIFLVQVIVAASLSMEVYMEGSQRLLRATWILQSAECAAKFCPMLMVLILGAWMRAQQMGKGLPQCWAQKAMYCAVVTLFLQLLVLLSTGSSATPAAREEDGKPGSQEPPPARVAKLEAAMQAATFMVLYGCVALVGASAIFIRPETAICEM